ncbi:hypothetical protein AB0885_35240, partial [Streptomyces sp. NPDC005534]|uniref:hypothetical protein n=1 Tax=unclassified Streptomyces TaxID=2593676 RepID=UPI0033BDCF29
MANLCEDALYELSTAVAVEYGTGRGQERASGPAHRRRRVVARNFAALAARAAAAATGIHSQCIGLQAGGEANLMVATRSVADSGP